MANYQSRYTGPEIDERLRKAGEAVLTEAQSLDTEKQAQARENIGAASSAAVDGKYTKPSGGIPASDLASGVQASLGKADTAYQKPQAGIPADDIAPGVIPDVSQFITDDDLSAALAAKQDTIADLADIRSGSQNNVKYTQQTLTDAQKAQARSNIGAGTYDKPDGGISESDLAQAVKDKLNATEIYPVTYGTTTQTQIAAAVAAGKLPVCKYGDNVYVYAGESSAGYSQFTSILYNTAARIYVKDSTWGNGNFEIYSKPSGGIPKSDLASGVQASLAKADTAYQKPQDGIPASDLEAGVIPTVPVRDVTLDDISVLDGTTAKLPAYPKSPRIFMGTCSTAAATVAKEATVEAFPLDANNKPLVGTVVGIKFSNTNSATAPTLNVNSTGAASIWYNNAAYEGKGAYGGSASRYIYYVWDGTYWAFQGWSYDADADTNTIGYNLRTNGGTAVAAAKFYRYRLLFTAPDGQSLVPSNTSSSTSTTAAKTVNQAKIDPFAPIWYYSTTTAVAANASVSASYLWLQYSAIPLGYAFNRTGAALTMTARYPVYLKCAPQSDGSAIMDADTPIVQALPSSEDGKIYILLGYAESEVNITLYYWHPVYYFKDGAIRQWTNAAAASVTVDQTYDGTSTNAQSGVAMAGALAGKQDTIDAQHKLDYGLLSNTPTIPAAQVNSDWNAGSGVAQILNKPNLATVATSGSYDDLSNKPVVDATPTANSNNLVKSGGVFDAIEDVMEAVDGSNVETVTVLPAASASTVGKIYYVGPDGNGEYARYRGIESGGSYSFLPLGSTAMDLTGYATKEEVEPLDQIVTGKTAYDSSMSSPSETDKYVYSTGQVFGSSGARISYLIQLEEGDIITVNIPVIVNTNARAIAVKNETGSGNPYTKIGVQSATGQAVYTYTATSRCKVGISYNASGGFSAVVQSVSLLDRVEDLEEDVAGLHGLEPELQLAEDVLDGMTPVALVVAATDKAFHYSYTDIQSAPGFSYSKPIWLNRGDKLSMTLVGGSPNGLYSAISVMRFENARYQPAVRQDGAVYEYEYTALYDCYCAVCFPSASEVTLQVDRVPIPQHIERVDPAEPVIIAPYHGEAADGSEGSIFDASTVTAEEIDAEAQRIVKNYPGTLSREVMGKDASGLYDIARYVFAVRHFYAYKAADKLFAWKSAGDAILYTKHLCPNAGDAVYNSSGVSAGSVASYNSTNSAMTVSGTSYARSTSDDIEADVVFLAFNYKDERESYGSAALLPGYFYVFDRDKKQLGTFSDSDFNLSTNTLTWNQKGYVRAESYDFGGEQDHTLVLWANEHAPTSDPAEPAITLLKMMQDLASSVADTNPLLRYIKYHCKVIFIPLVNPWAMTNRGTGRVNYNGVNINRNYDYKWESVGDADKGAAAGDQPETRYVMDTCGILNPDLAIDIHCLGTNGYINQVCYDAVLPEGGIEYLVQEMRNGYNKFLGKIGVGTGESPGEGAGFICKHLQIGGGLIEMNAGIPQETLHSAGIMQMDYDFLAKMIRMFFRITAPGLYITR